MIIIRKNIFFIVLLTLLCVLILTGCGKKGESVSAEPIVVETPTPEPTPTPTPTPTPEPDLPAGKAITMDGVSLESGSVIKNNAEYVKLSEAAEALGVEVSENEADVEFTWRRKPVSFSVDGQTLSYGEKNCELDAPVITYHSDVWVPVEAFCNSLDISLLYDEEFDRLYCTPGAGNWELPEGYRVPICMYHAVCDDLFPYALWDMCVRPESMEEQLAYLVDNGWDTIFYEDLEHVDEYDKPIILTYDDGYDNLYYNLFPLLKKYNCKVVIYLVTNNIENGLYNSLNREQIIEMHESGLVSFQSHTTHHLEMIYFDEETCRFELADSKLYITRLVGKEPFAMAYPYGMAYPITMELAMEYYRFGVRMGTFPYYTGDDPSFMWRVYVERDMMLPQFIYKIELEDPARATD